MTMTDNPTINTTTDEYKINQLNERIKILDTTIVELKKDIQCIDEALLAEATEREWCAEFDDFVDKVNKDLRRCSLTPRRQNFTASVTIAISYQALASEADDRIRDIMKAIHQEGDNLRGEEYTIGDWQIDHVEAD